MTVKISFDKDADVLYVRRETSELIVNSKESDLNSNLIINFDKDGNVIGVQIMFVSSLLEYPKLWHDTLKSDRASLPSDIRREIDKWIDENQFKHQNEKAEQIFGFLGKLGSKNKEEHASEAARLIFKDLSDRALISRCWVDAETIQEMLDSWREIIISQMK